MSNEKRYRCRVSTWYAAVRLVAERLRRWRSIGLVCSETECTSCWARDPPPASQHAHQITRQFLKFFDVRSSRTDRRTGKTRNAAYITFLPTAMRTGRWFTVSWLASIRHTRVVNTWTTFRCLSTTADTGIVYLRCHGNLSRCQLWRYCTA